MTRSYLDRLIARSSGEPGAPAAQPRARHEGAPAPLDDPFEQSAPLLEEPREARAPTLDPHALGRSESRVVPSAPSPAPPPVTRSLEPLRAVSLIVPRREVPSLTAVMPTSVPASIVGAETTASAAQSAPLPVRESAEPPRPLPEVQLAPRDELRPARSEASAPIPMRAAPPSLEPASSIARAPRAALHEDRSVEAPRPPEVTHHEPLERAAAARVEAPASLMPRPPEVSPQEPPHDAPRITIGRVRVEIVASAPPRSAPARTAPHPPAASPAGRRGGFPSKLRFGLGQS